MQGSGSDKVKVKSSEAVQLLPKRAETKKASNQKALHVSGIVLPWIRPFSVESARCGGERGGCPVHPAVEGGVPEGDDTSCSEVLDGDRRGRGRLVVHFRYLGRRVRERIGSNKALFYALKASPLLNSWKVVDQTETAVLQTGSPPPSGNALQNPSFECLLLPRAATFAQPLHFLYGRTARGLNWEPLFFSLDWKSVKSRRWWIFPMSIEECLTLPVFPLVNRR